MWLFLLFNWNHKSLEKWSALASHQMETGKMREFPLPNEVLNWIALRRWTFSANLSWWGSNNDFRPSAVNNYRKVLPEFQCSRTESAILFLKNASVVELLYSRIARFTRQTIWNLIKLSDPSSFISILRISTLFPVFFDSCRTCWIIHVLYVSLGWARFSYWEYEMRYLTSSIVPRLWISLWQYLWLRQILLGTCTESTDGVCLEWFELMSWKFTKLNLHLYEFCNSKWGYITVTLQSL